MPGSCAATFHRRLASGVALGIVASFELHSNTARASTILKGFVWDRSADWTIASSKPDNPGPDQLGNRVWEATYVSGGGSLGAQAPWYDQIKTIMQWDSNWWSSGVGVWAKGDNTNPCISQYQLTHNIANTDNSKFIEVPLVLWANPTSTQTAVNIAGNLKIEWSGLNGNVLASSPVDVDVVIGKVNSALGTTTLLYSTTVNRPAGTTILNLPVNISHEIINPQDRIFISQRARNSIANRWITMDDDITIVDDSGVAGFNLVHNGDFSLGNTAFSSSYAYNESHSSSGQYSVGTNPGSPSFTDHTGSGKMLLVNGSTATNTVIWQQTVAVNANTSYMMAGWLASWGGALGGTDTSPADLQILINGAPLPHDVVASSLPGMWMPFSRMWDSGLATSATISIIDRNLSATANDFALDDLSFATVPEPGALSILGIGAVGVLRRRVRNKQSKN